MNKIKKLLQKRNAKIVLSALLIVVVALPIFLLTQKPQETKKIAKKDSEKETFAHTDEGIIKEEEFNGLKFTNISLITDKGYTTFTADVTNTTGSELNVENVDIELQDKNGKTVITLLGNIGGTLKDSESRTISASAKGEFKNVKTKVIKAHE